ncbi:TIGR03084 family metal-binding protein [Kitasatospora sp. NPDC051984]|uniref:TIGR03084 family metal-binding protein n=1 Tax=Kitasatospora sp. NPDC051984 TaxID=3364059 RepID=UPI0037CA3A41
MDGLVADLMAEGAELDSLVAELRAAGWEVGTPAAGWTVAHQVSHLAWTDRWTLLAAQDPEGFAAALGREFADGMAAVDQGAAEGVGEEPAALLKRWRAGRAEVARVLAEVPADVRLPWFGPPMKARSMLTARLMETWAHGQDVADALGADRTPTDRLRHIAHLGVRTVGFAFAAHGLPAPTAPIRFELRSPGGELWAWGEEDATDRVSGPALDFCLLVTQRRHPDDLALTAEGDTARAWLPRAQAFAGPPGEGRKPLRRH